jgi:hypothetical protein
VPKPVIQVCSEMASGVNYFPFNTNWNYRRPYPIHSSLPQVSLLLAAPVRARNGGVEGPARAADNGSRYTVSG